MPKILITQVLHSQPPYGFYSYFIDYDSLQLTRQRKDRNGAVVETTNLSWSDLTLQENEPVRTELLRKVAGR